MKEASQWIPIEQIDMTEHDLRDRRDEKHMARMEESVLKDGIKSPIWVMQKKDGRYMVVAGATRLLVARRVGLKEIPACVTEKELDKGEILRQAWMENDLRADLSPLENAGSSSMIMRDAFRHQAHWKELIHSNGRGYYRLSPICSPMPALSESHAV